MWNKLEKIRMCQFDDVISNYVTKMQGLCWLIKYEIQWMPVIRTWLGIAYNVLISGMYRYGMFLYPEKIQWNRIQMFGKSS